MKHIATWIEAKPLPEFRAIFRGYPDTKLLNAREGETTDSPDALLLSGGGDISSGYLHQPVPDQGKLKYVNEKRDAWEFDAVAKALARRLPIFAICRGMQVLNVALGGTLHLDIPGHKKFRYDNVQPLVYANGAQLRIPKVNSSHHQALDQLGEGIEIEARHAEDGTIEQAHLRDYPFGLGVQYHPERDVLYRPLFDAFIEAVRRQKS